MNPRDLPEVVAELIMEMHEVRSELQGINGRIDRLESQMQATREENRENTDRLLAGFQRMLEPFLNRLLAHDDQLRQHEGRLNNLESPQQ
jgi:ubiquinone biosynthesis protein UbiJ